MAGRTRRRAARALRSGHFHGVDQRLQLRSECHQNRPRGTSLFPRQVQHLGAQGSHLGVETGQVHLFSGSHQASGDEERSAELLHTAADNVGQDCGLGRGMHGALDQTQVNESFTAETAACRANWVGCSVEGAWRVGSSSGRGDDGLLAISDRSSSELSVGRRPTIRQALRYGCAAVRGALCPATALGPIRCFDELRTRGPDMLLRASRHRISPQDLAQDRAFWTDLLSHNARSRALPQHTAGGYRNRRFAIIRDAAWITLYRAVTPYPQIGVFLRCTGPAGDAFFMLADHARDDLEQQLRRATGPGASLEWGSSHHPGMTDIAAVLAAPLPWEGSGAEAHSAWLLRAGTVWWTAFASLAAPDG